MRRLLFILPIVQMFYHVTFAIDKPYLGLLDSVLFRDYASGSIISVFIDNGNKSKCGSDYYLRSMDLINKDTLSISFVATYRVPSLYGSTPTYILNDSCIKDEVSHSFLLDSVLSEEYSKYLKMVKIKETDINVRSNRIAMNSQNKLRLYMSKDSVAKIMGINFHESKSLDSPLKFRKMLTNPFFATISPTVSYVFDKFEYVYVDGKGYSVLVDILKK